MISEEVFNNLIETFDEDNDALIIASVRNANDKNNIDPVSMCYGSIYNIMPLLALLIKEISASSGLSYHDIAQLLMIIDQEMGVGDDSNI